MAIQYKLILGASAPICATVSDTANPHLQLELRLEVAGHYNPYYVAPGAGGVLVEEIEVYYSGTSTEDFRLRGVTTDGKTPTIAAVKQIASGSFTTRVDWALHPANPGQIDWVFLDPATVGHWVSWTFNPSGGTPPVKVKVVLKRQDQPLASCP